MRRRRALILAITLITLLSGLMNLYGAVRPPHRASALLLHAMVPFDFEFVHIPRSIMLLIGFALTVSAANIYRRKRRAYQIVLTLASSSLLFHLIRARHWMQVLPLLALLAGLLYAHRSFTVKSRTPNWRAAATGAMLGLLVAFAYGVGGFWLLDAREFGINFDWLESIRRTVLFLGLVGDPTLVPHTRHAAWFLISLNVITITAIGYGLISLFRPILHHFHTLPHERDRATELQEKYARTALDYFKVWPDKSYFFDQSNECFIAYGVAANVAVALGDPIGPAEKLAPTIRAFTKYCDDNGWAVVWHQTLPDLLPAYREAGFRKLKIGDDAIVDLQAFSLEGKDMKRFRQRVAQLEKQGVQARHYDPPHSNELIDRLREVSDDWLQIPGKRERSFTLGSFKADYLNKTPIFTVEDKDGKVLAFVNLIASFHPGEMTIDLMRHRADAPNGMMDYLFTKLFLTLRGEGYTRFNLGMAPMSGFRDCEEATIAEKAVHSCFQHLNFIFSFRGLKQYKAKFADTWEPRYMLYRNFLDLPKTGIALSLISELPEQPERASSRA